MREIRWMPRGYVVDIQRIAEKTRIRRTKAIIFQTHQKINSLGDEKLCMML